jgi:hypothetical protein
MASGRGWSAQFPIAIVEMSNWPFTASAVTGGMPAADYIKAENERRATLYDHLAKDVSPDGQLRLEAFEEMYCDEDKKLHRLTVSNAYWVHAGHQRSQFVFFNAFVLFKKMQRDNAALTKKDDIKEAIQVDAFDLTVPAVVGTYIDLRDIIADQMQANSSAGKQKKLTNFDYLKSAVFLIGNDPEPRIAERPFRNLCAQAGVGDKAGSSGAMPRWAFLVASVNWLYAGATRLVERLMMEKHDKDEAGNKRVNPEWIDTAEVALGHEDAMCDISVIARLTEPSLKKLGAYIDQYGRNSKRVTQDKKPDEVSAIEYEVFERGYPWSKEEALAWVASRQKGNSLTYKEPKKVVADEPFKVETLKTLVESDRMPQGMRELLSERTKIPMRAGEDIPAETANKAGTLKEGLDFVWGLDLSSDTHKGLYDLICELGRLRDGNPTAFVQLVPELRTMVATAITSTPVVPSEQPAQDSGASAPESNSDSGASAPESEAPATEPEAPATEAKPNKRNKGK